MVLFWRLVLAHFLADFTFQTNAVATWKRQSVWGMAVHVLTHPLMYFILAWPYLSMTWVTLGPVGLKGWFCVLMIAALHWAQDEWRIWAIQKTGAPDNTGLFLWDQLVHLVVLFGIAPSLPKDPSEPWILILLCGALLAHFTSVLIFFVENDLWGESTQLGNSKYVFIGERIIGASLFLLPGAWFLLSLVWVGWVLRQHYKPVEPRTWAHEVIGNSTVVLLGLIARGILIA